MQKILVWDWPVRIGHWLLVGAFALAWLTGDSEEWRLVHAFAGGTVVGAILFRLLWGVIGTRHARFASFVRGVDSVLDYLRGLVSGRAPHATGHNPAGGWAILALLALGLLTGAAGWLTFNEVGGELFEEVHEALATTMLAVAMLHVAGVIAGSLAHRENLVRSMLTGMKQGVPAEAIAGARLWAVPLLLVWVAACAWWLAR